MARSIVAFASLLLAGLVVGTMLGVWLAYDPSDLSPTAYVVQQQHAIRALEIVMPLLGALTCAVTIAWVIVARHNRPQAILLVIALTCFVVSALVTRYLNQPINALMITWSAADPPANWMALRDAWRHWHLLRMVAGVIGMSLLIAASLLADQAQTARLS